MPETIHVKLPDGSTKEVPKGTTPLEVAKSISPRLADAAIVAKTNGDLIDLTRPLEKDTDLRILTEKDPEALQVYRHSSAHLLAAAVLELFPETKLGHGPATESGFFYDFYRPTPFTPVMSITTSSLGAPGVLPHENSSAKKSAILTFLD